MIKKLVSGVVFSGVLFSGFSGECKNYTPEQVKKYVSQKLGINSIESVSKIEGGYYEIIFNNRGNKIPLYVDCQVKYLISGQLIDIEKRKNITREKIAKLQSQVRKEKEKEFIAKIGKEKYELLKKSFPGRINSFSVVSLGKLPKDGLIEVGNKDAKKVIYILTDPQCPFCARLHSTIEKVVKKRKDVKFKMIFYPLPFHRNAKDLASAVICSNEPDMLSIIFKSQRNRTAIDKFSSMKCDKGNEILKSHMEFGHSVGVRGTPTIILSNGLKTSGALPEKDIEKLIDLL